MKIEAIKTKKIAYFMDIRGLNKEIALSNGTENRRRMTTKGLSVVGAILSREIFFNFFTPKP